MLLSLNAPPNGDCTPSLLTIPQPLYLHVVPLQGFDAGMGGEQGGVTYYLPAAIEWSQERSQAGAAVAAAIRDEHVRLWLAQRPQYTPDKGGYVVIGPEWHSPTPTIEWNTGGAGMMQLRTGAGLVVFTQDGPKAFVMKFYPPSQFDVPQGHLPGQWCPLHAGAVAKSTWRVECLPAEGNAVQVTAEPDAVNPKVTKWTFENGAWAMSTDGESRIDWKKVEPLGTGTKRTVKVIGVTRVGLGAPVESDLQQVETDFDQFHRTIQTIEGTGADALMTHYVNPADPQNEVEAMWRSDGYFEKHLYSGPKDVLPYTKTVIRPWLDVTYANANPANARATETRTEALDGGTLVTTTEKIAGNVIGRTTRWSQTKVDHSNIAVKQPITTVVTRSYARDSSGALVSRQRNPAPNLRSECERAIPGWIVGRDVRRRNQDDVPLRDGLPESCCADGQHASICRE